MMHTSKLLSRGCNFYTYTNNQKDDCLYTQKSSDLSFRLYKGLDHKLDLYMVLRRYTNNIYSKLNL